MRAKPGGSGGASGGPGEPEPDVDRPATRFDDLASGLFTISILIFAAGLVYLLFGMWSGNFADPNWTATLHHDDRVRILGNIGICGNVMWISLAVATVAFLFLYYHEDYAGYMLLGAALVLLLGVPYGTQLLYSETSHAFTDATRTIYALLSSQSWLIGIPGVLLTVFNIARSLANGLAVAKTKRSTYRFGQHAVKDVKPRNQFLGPCWNLPYCKEGVRSRCPIFLGKRGPCWQNKRGCMCDQTILLIAQAPNWKQSVASTVGKLENKNTSMAMPELPPQPQLSREAKNERCRQCVIYNLHQEQKYKLLVGIVIAAFVAFIAVFYGPLLAETGNIFMTANALVGKFSITSNTAPLFPNGAPAYVEWMMLGSVLLVGMAKILQLVEYCCFKLKI